MVEEAGVDHERRIFRVGDPPCGAAAANRGHIETPLVLIDSDDMYVDVVGVAEAVDAAVVETGSDRPPVDAALSVRSVFLFFVSTAPGGAVVLGGDQDASDGE